MNTRIICRFANQEALDDFNKRNGTDITCLTKEYDVNAKTKVEKVALPNVGGLSGLVLNQADISTLDTYVGGLLKAKDDTVTKKTLSDRKKKLQACGQIENSFIMGGMASAGAGGWSIRLTSR